MIETTQEDDDGIFILNGVFAYSERYQQNDTYRLEKYAMHEML